MKFCSVCDNMMFTKMIKVYDAAASEDNEDDRDNLEFTYELKLECRNCGHQTKNPDSCIMKNEYADDRTVYKRFMSEYIVHDATLPRVGNIKCPTCNPDSTKESSTKEGNETDTVANSSETSGENNGGVIYVKYDVDLKFLYCCEKCKTFWKSG